MELQGLGQKVGIAEMLKLLTEVMLPLLVVIAMKLLVPVMGPAIVLIARSVTKQTV